MELLMMASAMAPSAVAIAFFNSKELLSIKSHAEILLPWHLFLKSDVKQPPYIVENGFMTESKKSIEISLDGEYTFFPFFVNGIGRMKMLFFCRASFKFEQSLMSGTSYDDT